MLKEDRGQGYISLYRSLLEWEWYGDINTSRLFIHLLLTVNYADAKVRGRVIRRGQRLTSIQKLADETGLSFRQARTALEHLKATNEVASAVSPQGTVITVKNYAKYQGAANGAASKRQTSGKQDGKRAANERQTTSNKNNNIPPISPTGDVFAVYAAGDERLLAALNAFEEMRRKIKRPMTDTAKQRLLKKLDSLSETAEGRIDLLDEAVLHCWQSVYPAKGPDEGKAGKGEYDDAI